MYMYAPMFFSITPSVCLCVGSYVKISEAVFNYFHRKYWSMAGRHKSTTAAAFVYTNVRLPWLCCNHRLQYLPNERTSVCLCVKPLWKECHIDFFVRCPISIACYLARNNELHKLLTHRAYLMFIYRILWQTRCKPIFKVSQANMLIFFLFPPFCLSSICYLYIWCLWLVENLKCLKNIRNDIFYSPPGCLSFLLANIHLLFKYYILKKDVIRLKKKKKTG